MSHKPVLIYMNKWFQNLNVSVNYTFKHIATWVLITAPSFHKGPKHTGMKHITSHKCVWTNLLYEFLSRRCSETRSLPTSDCSSFCSSKKSVNSSLRSLFFLEKVLLIPDLNCYVVNQGTLRYRNQFVSMSFFYIQNFLKVFSMKQYMFNPCYNMFSLSLTIFHSILFFSQLFPLLLFLSVTWRCIEHLSFSSPTYENADFLPC